MEYTNKYLSDNFETKANLDSSFGLGWVEVSGSTVTGNLTVDGSVIIKGFNDASLYWISVNIEGEPSANIII